MWEVTRKGLLAHKFRLLLTSISIVLGVAFVAGTLVFTDTIGSVFDHLFQQTTHGTDAVVRAHLPFKVNRRGGGGAVVTCCVATATKLSPVKGSWPVTSS